VHADTRPPYENNRPEDGLSKLSSKTLVVEVDILLGEIGHRTTLRGEASTDRPHPGSKSSQIP
jgi:hypothetical protein